VAGMVDTQLSDGVSTSDADGLHEGGTHTVNTIDGKVALVVTVPRGEYG
jgi:hypothetical protein